MTPTELAKMVNETLMEKPNKGVIFKSFINNVDHASFFIEHCVKNIDTPITLINQIINECNRRIEGMEEEEHTKDLETLTAVQKRIKDYEDRKKKKGV